MNKLTFTVSTEISESYPKLRIGVLTGYGLTNKEVNSDLNQMTRDTEAKLRKQLTNDSLMEHPHIKVWQDTYKGFGIKLKKHRPTCEALVRRVLKEEKLPSISVIVNCYLLAELEYLIPCGGYDFDKLNGALRLRYSLGGENFVPFGNSEPELTNPGEIIYADDTQVLTRRWNYKDCDSTKVTLDTKNIILMTEAPSDMIQTETVCEFLKRLSELLSTFAGGTLKLTVVNNEGQSRILDLK